MIIFKKNIYNYIIIHNNNSYKIQNFIIYDIFCIIFQISDNTMPNDDKRPIRSWNIHLQVKYLYFDVHLIIVK